MWLIHVCDIWLVCMCHMTHSYMWHDVLQCVAVCCSVLQCVAVCCSVLQCVATRCMWYVQYDVFIYVYGVFVDASWRIHICDMMCCSVLQCVAVCCNTLLHRDDSYVWNGSFVCATRRVCMCDMTRTYARHDSLARVTWDMVVSSSVHFTHFTHLTHFTHFLAQRNVCLSPPLRLSRMCDIQNGCVWFIFFGAHSR